MIGTLKQSVTNNLKYKCRLFWAMNKIQYVLIIKLANVKINICNAEKFCS